MTDIEELAILKDQIVELSKENERLKKTIENENLKCCGKCSKLLVCWKWRENVPVDDYYDTCEKWEKKTNPLNEH